MNRLRDYISEYVERLQATQESQEARGTHQMERSEPQEDASVDALGEYRRFVRQLRYLPDRLLMQHAVALWDLTFAIDHPVRHRADS